MRAILFRLVCTTSLAITLVACGGGSVDPRIIPGGGIGDGAIDGTLNLYVIDSVTDLPVAATVGVGELAAADVDATGLLVTEDVEGPQTIAVKAAGYRSAVWVGANGANVTIPLEKLDPGRIAQATLSGTITGYDAVTVPSGHAKAAVALYAQSDRLGDAANELVTPNNESFCIGATGCAWSLVSRAGTLHVVAAILDIDPHDVANPDDDTIAVVGWASAAVTVVDGVNQSGIALALIEAGNLATVTVDMGTPPGALAEEAALIGIELGDDEVVQVPISFLSTTSSILMPTLAAFPGSTYRLTAVAQTVSGEDGAQSIVIRRGLATTTLAAGTWLVPPTGVQITRSTATWTPVAGALIHSVSWTNTGDDNLLEITVLDPAVTSVTVPALVAVPAVGALTGRVGGIGATFDPTDFSLDEDIDLLTGIAQEPVAIP